ncbi:MAG: CBS domain-containing protein [Clostridia bacterium]|nr:CBS domain-containing protein [Clostridia bacterium]
MNVAFFLKPKNEVSYLLDDFSVRQGLEKMCFHGYTAIPVLDKDGHYLTTISEGDFLWYIIRGENTEENHVEIKTVEGVKIRDIMKSDKNPPVKITATMEELFLKAMDQNFVPVVDDRGFFIGIVTRRDLIKYFYANSEY